MAEYPNYRDNAAEVAAVVKLELDGVSEDDPRLITARQALAIKTRRMFDAASRAAASQELGSFWR